MGNFQSAVIGCVAVLVFGLFTALVMHGCSVTQEKNYRAFSECVATGGSYVPLNSGDMCLKK